MSQPPIFVTQPHLPPLEEFVPYLEQIWASKMLANGGPFHQQLEQALCEYLGVKHISLFVNGTVALLTAVQALDLKGEVITTPYSFVATSHAIAMNGLTPVFVDIDPESMNLDPARIEAAITPHTTAIMPVHCYGRPCEVKAIERIAERHGLKVVYDAAHAFGVRDEGGGVLRHGDLSILSFHATKVFNTFEGGAIVCPDLETKQRIDRLKNFGFATEVMVTEIGTNGKMSEINAAFGLVQLRHLDEALQRRALLSQRYCEQLADVAGIRVVDVAKAEVPNHAYFPILVEDGYPLGRDGLYDSLKQAGIFSRRYFYPLISDFPMYRSLPSANPGNLPVARRLADQVLCLPLYPALSPEDQDRVVQQVRRGGLPQ
jgi:dTDP-4-amino-4,6-dideoxygalactose transaminase